MTIRKLLDALHSQTWPLSQLEVLVVDGRSADDTREVVSAYAAGHSMLPLRLIDNPSGTIPSALNLGIQTSRGSVIVRLDAHSVPRPDYIERCVKALEATGAANVGGLWEIRPSTDTWIGRSIAVAAGHPLGAGGARYRIRGPGGTVDTVPFGAFRREWLEKVGPFNEILLSNEDYEYNLRLRQAGGAIWFDPEIRSEYYARASLRAVARQYQRYGYWKGRMLGRNPRSLRWRQALPALFVLGLASLAIAALLAAEAGRLLGIFALIYISTTLMAGVVQGAKYRDPALILGFSLALWTMHLSWGSAFWVGLTHSAIKAVADGPRS